MSVTETKELRELVDDAARKAFTKRLDISLNELADMHTSGELEISPEFQRNFVWKNYQQSQFIESLLLELPTPPFYLVEHETEEGKYQLVDGLQRLSSYLHFIGELDNQEADENKVEKGSRLVLEGCDIITALNEHEWDTLPSVLKFRLRRSFISVNIIQHSSDRELKYHMFKRLNAGGTVLSEQQIRNCSIRMLGGKFLDFIEECASYENYRTCIEPLTEEARKRQDDKSLVLRYFAFKNDRSNFVHDVNPFLDSYLEGVTRYLSGLEDGENRVIEFSIDDERAKFRKIFDILEASTSSKSFTFPNKKTNTLTAGFSMYHFEGVITGLAPHVDSFDSSNKEQMERLKNNLEQCRCSEAFIAVSSGGGRNSSGPARTRFELIQNAVTASI